jgi:hypothetical protein
MMIREMNKALSVKACYSNLLFSAAVFVLTLLLSAAFFIHDSPNRRADSTIVSEVVLLD